MTLTLTFALLLKKKLNHGYNFWTKRDKTFILQVCVLCSKTFLSVPNILTFTLTLTFDLPLKKLNIGYNFWTKRDKAFILHTLVPCGKTFLSISKKMDLVTLTLTFDLLMKKLNLAYNFEPREIRLSYYRYVFLYFLFLMASHMIYNEFQISYNTMFEWK